MLGWAYTHLASAGFHLPQLAQEYFPENRCRLNLTPQTDPETWTETELRRWLRAVSSYYPSHKIYLNHDADDKQRNLEASSKMTREQLVERVKANLRPERAGT